MCPTMLDQMELDSYRLVPEEGVELLEKVLIISEISVFDISVFFWDF